MNEIEEMRQGMDRAEKNLIRMRWICTNARQAIYALERAIRLHGENPDALAIVEEIDHARTTGR